MVSWFNGLLSITRTFAKLQVPLLTVAAESTNLHESGSRVTTVFVHPQWSIENPMSCVSSVWASGKLPTKPGAASPRPFSFYGKRCHVRNCERLHGHTQVGPCNRTIRVRNAPVCLGANIGPRRRHICRGGKLQFIGAVGQAAEIVFARLLP